MTSQDSILLYLQQQQKDAHENLTAIQRHDGDQPYHRRHLTTLLEQAIDDFPGEWDSDRWFVITGPRGVGKTTVLAQAYTYLKESQPQRRFNHLYIALDDIIGKVDTNLGQILDSYQNLLGVSWVQNPTTTFIFIDEVQIDPRWARFLKAIYDKSRNVFFVCAGSSAADLQIDADVAGRRARLEKLHPLNFTEYQFLTQGVRPPLKLKFKLLEVIYHSASAAEAFEALKKLKSQVDRQWANYDRNSLGTYLTVGTLPLGLGHKETVLVYSDLDELIDQVISYDLSITHSFGAKSSVVIRRLLFLLATAGDIVSFNKLTGDLKTNSRQLWLMFDALQKAGLIIKVPAYGGHFATTKRPARYHFMSPALRAALYNVVGNPAVDLIHRGNLLKDIASLHYYRDLVRCHPVDIAHPCDKKSENCDFILGFLARHQLAIEFEVGDKGIKQVAKAMTKIDCRYGLVFANSQLSLDPNKAIVTVPLDYFYLM